ncbi:unnamed protein product [Prunus armeniaca]
MGFISCVATDGAKLLMLFLGGEKVRTFSKGRACRRQSRRSSRQASDTVVVLAEGFPMLKLVMSGKFDRVTIKGSESGRFTQNFDVGLCASCCGDDTCPWRLGSAVESFGSREFQHVSGTSEEYLPSAGEKVCLPWCWLS